MAGKVLLGDLSIGMVMKLALAEPGRRPEVLSLYGCDSFDDCSGAIEAFLADNGSPKLMGAAFSTSGWEVDGHIDLVHYGFSLDRSELCRWLGTPRVTMVNDFVAKALAIPVLERDERVKVCGDDVAPGPVVAVVGPTAGLGGAFLAPNGRGGWVATHCEGGHADFAPCNALEVEIFKLMLAKYGHVSRERAVSAPGLSELWRCLAVIDGETPESMTVEEIMAQAFIGEARAVTAVRVQTELYAGVASDFALMTGAKGGVYLSGSHLTALGSLFDHDVFTRRFYDKGRVASYVRDIPVYQIVADEAEILGVSTLFDDLAE
ncbi:glucokinase family protein [Asticcacaulis biprosthecium C19]|uniref:Glucokinase family protein n=1 Tax=Asticcacaulis biprosthecium C19 TaxID=715226 RepID=F4QPH7_9CAUL|nr:glucokinase [Asticcacaulis biprosthecium]EGF91235.1 glucokinase family protein [Asticcacaulis biprosthecium C19]